MFISRFRSVSFKCLARSRQRQTHERNAGASGTFMSPTGRNELMASSTRCANSLPLSVAVSVGCYVAVTFLLELVY